ncbi:MAG TPA: MBL fold metallo-hydrolase [Terracidiphilus sp.]|jgi:competence protein ComEC|nr:MBL fold metallo-hydrolase [Terracidiphilus sp.]
MRIFLAHRMNALVRRSAARVAVLLLSVGLALPIAARAQSGSHLLIYSIDVEGGQATLFVAPSKASLLVDTGWPNVDSTSSDPYQKGLAASGTPDNNGRDTERIQNAMKDAGITQIDHVFITHFHTDHVGGVPNLVQHVKVGEFLDHGENREDADVTRHDYAAYIKAIGSTPRRIVHPGDTIDIPGLSIVVLTADGEHIKAVPGIKPEPNPYCAKEPHWDLDTTENPRSAGFLLRYGKFRFLDLGDLTKAKEIPLVCPKNLIGTVDVYLVNHHGFNLSNSKAFVDAIHPRVAIMDNGAHKAGSPEAWQTVHESPGLEDLYMLHTAEGSDAAHNSADAQIANLKGANAPDGQLFKIVADDNGTFTVWNSRTGATKAYIAH